MASESDPNVPQSSDEARSTSVTAPSALQDSGRETDEKSGNFCRDQTGMYKIRRHCNTKLLGTPVRQVALKRLHRAKNNVFAVVKRPSVIQRTRTFSRAKVQKRSTVSNERLASENESLRKELEDLKLQVDDLESWYLLLQQEQRDNRSRTQDQILGVLKTDMNCAICSEIMMEAVAIECGHVFCSHCISTWFKRKSTSRSCPICRAVTYKNPVKLSIVDTTIASFYELLPQEVQSDRMKNLVDRKADQEKAQEAARSQRRRTRNSASDLETLTPIIGSSSRRRQLRPSRAISASEGRAPGQDQSSAQA